MRTARTAAAALCGLALAAVPTAASAATKPSVSTGGVAKLTFNSVQLAGNVDPNGTATQYAFQYGPTTKYVATTPLASAGSGGSNQRVTATISGLTPDTTYHFRLAISSSAGGAHGKDVSFKTKRQPLGLSLGATPTPVPYGSPTTLTGNLAGTGNAGKAVVLKQNPFPFTAGLQPFGNQIVTDKQGNFSLPLLDLKATTQFQAVVNGTNVASSIFTLPVSLDVSTSVTKHRVKRGRSIRFSGSVRPIRDGQQVAIQKKSPSGKWVTVSGTTTRHKTDTRSVYGKTIKISRGGTYRVFVGTQGDLAPGYGPEIDVSTYR